MARTQESLTADDLKEWMKQHGYSVRRLAADLGVSWMTVQRWRDTSRPVPPWLSLALVGLQIGREQKARMPRQRVSSGGPWEERVGYSRAVRVGDHVWVSGCTGTLPDGVVLDGIEAQTRHALGVAAGALEAAGVTLQDAVMVRLYLVDFAEFESIHPVLREHFGASRPAMTAVQVAALIDPRHRIEIEVQAAAGSA